jgi:hypothetical protein
MQSRHTGVVDADVGVIASSDARYRTHEGEMRIPDR